MEVGNVSFGNYSGDSGTLTCSRCGNAVSASSKCGCTILPSITHDTTEKTSQNNELTQDMKIRVEALKISVKFFKNIQGRTGSNALAMAKGLERYIKSGRG